MLPWKQRKWKSVGFKTYVDCLHTFLRFSSSRSCAHTFNGAIKLWKKTNRKTFLKLKTMFSFCLLLLLLLLLLLGFYYFNFSFFVFNFFRTHMLSQDVSKWLSMSKYGVGVSMRIFFCVWKLCLFISATPAHTCISEQFLMYSNMLVVASNVLLLFTQNISYKIKWQKSHFLNLSINCQRVCLNYFSFPIHRDDNKQNVNC